MANYGIFRVEKLKKIANLRGSLMHAFREQDTPNADPKRKAQNILLTPDTHSVATTLAKYERLKPTGKIRSDVVHALEVLVTASPEKISSMTEQERKAFFDDAMRFCNAKFGEGNLLHAQIHNDETTAHLTAFYIPVIEKEKKNGEVVRRLNASSFLGGKKEYSQRQTEFYEQVSKKYGLERGEIGSKATHKRILDWYSELNTEKLDADFDVVLGKLEKVSSNVISVDVEEAKQNFLGVYTKTETVKKQIKLNKRYLSLPSVREALSPYQNRNSEMKRREKQAIKNEVKREIEADVTAKTEAKVNAEYKAKMDYILTLQAEALGDREKAKLDREAAEKERSQVEQTKNMFIKFRRFISKSFKEFSDQLGVKFSDEEIKTYSGMKPAISRGIDSLVKQVQSLKGKILALEENVSLYKKAYYDQIDEVNAVKREKNEIVERMKGWIRKAQDYELELNEFRKPRQFNELKNEYYKALDKETKNLLDKLDQQLNIANGDDRYIGVAEKIKAFNLFNDYFKELECIDVNFAVHTFNDRYSKHYQEAFEYIQNNKHRLNYQRMRM